jgi:hypothetical protein
MPDNSGFPRNYPSQEGAPTGDPGVQQALRDDRLTIIQRARTGWKRPGSGWRADPMLIADDDYTWWERPILFGPETEIVEQVVCGPDDTAPTGPGWRRRTEPGDWMQRPLWDQGRDSESEEDADQEYALLPAEQPGRVIGSSVARPVTGNRLRAFLTLGLTGGVVLVVLVGILTRLPTDQFAAYIAPLLTLSGTALGYWFGSEGR